MFYGSWFLEFHTIYEIWTRFTSNKPLILMRTFIFTLLVLAAFPLQGQRFFLQLQPDAGYSSITPGILPYKLRSSYQLTVSGGLCLSERSALKLGIGVQQSGARTRIFYTPSSPAYDFLYQDTYFVKIPVDYSIRLGSRGLFILDIGAYYNLNITNRVIDPGRRVDYFPLDAADFTKNDAGLRLRPAIEIPFSPKYFLSLGILQEIGLVALVPQSHHYNTYLTGGVKVIL
jgi:hypothetical protein